MSDRRLVEAIWEKLSTQHVGSSRAIHIANLLDYLRVTGYPNLNEREMRENIEDHLPKVCSNVKGYFVAADGRERDEAALYHRKKGLGSLARAKRIVEAYPEFGPEQLRLPGTEGRA